MSLDFAGGTVIHITSGWAGLVIALMLGRRLGYGKVRNGASQHIFRCSRGSVAVGRMVWLQCWFCRQRCHKRYKRIRSDTGCHWYGGSDLGPDILGTYWKTFNGRGSVWCSSRACCNHACIGIRVTNVCNNNWHCSWSCMLCSTNL